MAFCVPPKNGCTAFKAMMLRSQGINFRPTLDDIHGRKVVPFRAEKLGMELTQKILDDPTWTWVTTTRHPIDRFVSAFVDKILGPPDLFRRKYGCCAYVLEFPDRCFLACPIGVDALLGIVLGAINEWEVNAHFAPQTVVCMADVIKYDVTFQVNGTLSTNMRRLLASKGLDPEWFPPDNNVARHATSASEKTCRYLKQSQVDAVMEVYDRDVRALWLSDSPGVKCAA